MCDSFSLSEFPFRAPIRTLKLVNLWRLFFGLFWNGRNYESHSNSLSGYFSFLVLSLPKLYNNWTWGFKSWNLCHAQIFLKWMISIIGISYYFHILLYILSCQLSPLFIPKWLHVYLLKCLIILRKQTTHSQCFSIKARHRDDLSCHSLYPIANSQYSPQGNDALNVS